MELKDIIKIVVPFIIGTFIDLSKNIDTPLKKILLEILRFGPIFLTLYFMYPKNYIRSLSYFWRKDINVEYIFSAKLENYELSKGSGVEDIINYVEKFDEDRIVLFKEELKGLKYIFLVDNSNVTVDFRNGIYIYSKYDVNYNTFYKKISYVMYVISCMKSKLGIKYDPKEHGGIQIEIIFKDDKTNKSINCTNPLWLKLFNGFDIKTSEMVYVAKNGSKVVIGSDRTSFYNKEISLINKDIKNELYSPISRKIR